MKALEAWNSEGGMFGPGFACLLSGRVMWLLCRLSPLLMPSLAGVEERFETLLAGIIRTQAPLGS